MVLSLPDLFSSYTITNDFFSRSDSFSLEIAGRDKEDLIQILNKLTKGGDIIKLRINGQPKLTGFIDKIDIKYGSSGTTMTISGRDRLGLMIDSTTTPETQAKPSDTLLTALYKAFEPFGFTKEDIIWKSGDEALHKSIGSKLKPGPGVQFSGRKTFQDPTRKVNRKQRAKKGEGAMQFAMRIAEHAGLFINLSENGEKILISPPVYKRSEGAPQYQVVHLTTDPEISGNTIMNGSIHIGWDHQISMIIAEGTSGGGEFRKQTSKVIAINELTSVNSNGSVNPDVQTKIDEYNEYGQSTVLPLNQKLIDEKMFSI